jgi:hypothetical protein
MLPLRLGQRRSGAEMTIAIAVYADWDGLPEPLRLGWLHANRTRGREVFEFEFDTAVLDAPALVAVPVDPRLGLYEGRQHPAQGSDTFGVFADASPDRWGRLLMRRRLERAQRAGHVTQGVRLHESDYLLGVHDMFRLGALRFRLDDAGEFLDNQHDTAAPPFVKLRQLEAASLAIERDEDNTEDDADAWLRMLIAPGGSLGGSAMTLTGHRDGDDASTGASYLEIARVLVDHGAETNVDLRELWSRLVFNVLVSNTDDHLRNHGCLLMPGRGWRLSEVFDVNPAPGSFGLALNISETDNALDLELVRSVAPSFRVKPKAADKIITSSQAIVKQWRRIAGRLDLSARACDRMAPAFRLAG